MWMDGQAHSPGAGHSISARRLVPFSSCYETYLSLEGISMNWDRITGRWKQWMGLAQEKWGKLTDDDMAIIAGRREQFAGLLQERYGYVKSDAEKAIDDFARELKL
jgi:uncharacterized protein YjbJ (UPF0337 family)